MTYSLSAGDDQALIVADKDDVRMLDRALASIIVDAPDLYRQANMREQLRQWAKILEPRAE
jgi:hypothetical protein